MSMRNQKPQHRPLFPRQSPCPSMWSVRNPKHFPIGHPGIAGTGHRYETRNHIMENHQRTDSHSSSNGHGMSKGVNPPGAKSKRKTIFLKIPPKPFAPRSSAVVLRHLKRPAR